MKSKPAKETESIKHPFTKKKLKVADAFICRNLPCSKCEQPSTFYILDGDLPSIRSYNLLECKSCNTQLWYVVNVDDH